VHIHGNNHGDLSINHELPNSLEISFIHKDLVKGSIKPYRGALPRAGLDTANKASEEDYKIDLFEMNVPS
jgi:hypothetical protein